MRRADLAVSVLLPVLGLGGCFLSHGLDGSGPRRDATPRPDASVSADSGRLDTGVDAAADGGTTEPPRCTLSLARERLVADADEGQVQAPDVFWTGERLGVVVMHGATSHHPEVKLTHVGPDLEDPTPMRRVSDDAHSWGEAAWTGDAIGVCWNGDPGGPTSALRFREVPGLDGALGPRTDFEPENGPCLDLQFARDRYAMTWRYQRSEGDEVIVDSSFGLFERDGSPASERIEVATAPYPGRTPSMVDTGDGYLVVAPVEDALRILRIDEDGTIADERSLDAPDVTYANAAMRDGRLGLLSLRGSRETRALVFQTLDRDLRVTTEREIASGAPRATHPRLLARPEGWTLVWNQGYRPTTHLMLLSLDPGGEPLAPRQVLYEGANSAYGGPSLVSVEDSVYVALSHPETELGGERTYVQRWECDEPAADLCRPQRAHFGDCDGDRVGGWRWRWTGEACEPVVGCPSDCVGPDCASLARTRFACESDRRECGPRACRAVEAPAMELCGPAELEASTATPVQLTIDWPSCDCAPPPSCRARVASANTIALELEDCREDGPRCDCVPPDEPTRVQCILPPMQAGDWQIEPPGGDTVDITVRPPWEEADASRECR